MLSMFNAYHQNYGFQESNRFLVWKAYALLKLFRVTKLNCLGGENRNFSSLLKLCSIIIKLQLVKTMNIMKFCLEQQKTYCIF